MCELVSMLVRSLLLSLALSCCVLSPLTASAQELIQTQSEHYFDKLDKKVFRWNDTTTYVMVYIADGSHLPDWNPENPQLVRQALSEWAQALGGRIRFSYLPDERGADVQVHWKRVMDADKGEHVAGYNETRTWGKFMERNNIILALHHRDGVPYSARDIHSVALHEAGHMMGLRSHSDNPQDVMYPSTVFDGSEDYRHLSARDIRTVQMLYEKKPEFTNPEGYRLYNMEAFKKKHPGGRRFSIIWTYVPGVPVPIPIPLPF